MSRVAAGPAGATTGIEPGDVDAALRSVDDPEYPGISIVDLGLVERIAVDGATVTVELIPTFTGCPALELIAADVRAAVEALDGVDAAVVRFVPAPVWSPERITPAARTRLAESFTVAVALADRGAACPHCGAAELVEQSMFGPVRCRSVHRCRACGEHVEMVR